MPRSWTAGDLTGQAHESFSRGDHITLFKASSVNLGSRTELTFTIDNTANPNPVTEFDFTDTLPSGMVVADPASASTDCGSMSMPAALIADPGTDVISLVAVGTVNSPALGAGSSCTVTVDVFATTPGQLGNLSDELTAMIGRTSLSSGKAGATLLVTRDEIHVKKEFLADPVAPGDTVDVRFTVTNFDRNFPATSIAFTDHLTTTLLGLVTVGLAANNVCGAGSTLSGTGTLMLTGGNLGSGESCVFTATLQVPGNAAPGDYINTTSTITAVIDGANVMGAPAEDALFVAAVPRLTKMFINDPVVPGEDVTLRFTITNTDTGGNATDIAFTDNLDQFLQDAAVQNLPASGFCGAGSSIEVITVSQPGEDGPPEEVRLLSMTSGSLGPDAPCTFDVTLTVPPGTSGRTYTNTTSNITATVGGQSLTGRPATDVLQVVAAPQLTKRFLDDAAIPGGTVVLDFMLAYDENATANATSISFTDDLGATLSGLTAIGLPANNVCGVGSNLNGTSMLTFTGGSLMAGSSCTFRVTLQIPDEALPGSFTNTTSDVTATVLNKTATGSPASDELDVGGLTFTKSFTNDPVAAGGTVNLEFVITNNSPVASASGITFSDDLAAALSGLVAVAADANDVCGPGSRISGTDTITLTGGSLDAGEPCRFSVTLQIPAAAEPGEYANQTGDLSANIGGTPVTLPGAADNLVVALPLTISKSFSDNAVLSGDNVTLTFTLTNLSPTPVTQVAFTDDLNAALPGLAAVGLPTVSAAQARRFPARAR